MVEVLFYLVVVMAGTYAIWVTYKSQKDYEHKIANRKGLEDWTQ